MGAYLPHISSGGGLIDEDTFLGESSFRAARHDPILTSRAAAQFGRYWRL